MHTVDKAVGGVLALIALYLIVFNYSGVNQILNGLAGFNRTTFSTLQGR